jgi:energy-converting hydrogenase Eha subunit B
MVNPLRTNTCAKPGSPLGMPDISYRASIFKFLWMDPRLQLAGMTENLVTPESFYHPRHDRHLTDHTEYMARHSFM